MRSQLVVCLLGVAFSASWAEDASCPDADHDQCTLLQNSVGVAIEHDDDEDHDSFHLIQGNARVASANGGDQHETEAAQMDVENAEEDINLEEGWPGLANFMKKDKLVKEFLAVEAAAAAYRKAVHHHVNAMTAAVKPSMGVVATRGKVRILFIELQKASQLLTKSLHKVTAAWVTDFGQVGPLIGAANMTDAMKNVLVGIDAEGKALVTAFYAESQALGGKVKNATLACSNTKHSLSTVFHKAAGFARKVEALSPNSLSKELQKAIDMLPKTPKEEIDKILKKATSAADRLLRVLTPSMKDIANGVAKAFESHCEGFPHYSAAGRTQASILSLLAFAIASFFL